MEGKDLEAEIHPLKNEEGQEQKAPVGPGKEAAESPHSRLSRCRAAAFFTSLFLCLLVVFVVSFIIPCPERPASQRAWSVNFSGTATLNFLATEDIDNDKIQDVLFIYTSTNDSDLSNHSCADQGFSSPCSIMAALSGANGSVLWAKPVAQDKVLADCGLLSPKSCSTCILTSLSGSMQAIKSCTGNSLWSQLSSLGSKASVLSPLLLLPDMDADGVLDLLMLSQDGQVHSSVISGRTGFQIGHQLSLGVEGVGRPLLHLTSMGAYYVLLPCRTSRSLCSWSLKEIHKQVTGREDTVFKGDALWEDTFNATVSRLLLHNSGGIHQVVRVLGARTEELLVVAAEALALLSDQEQEPRWILGSTRVLRTPIIGNYKPQAKAVAVENGTNDKDRQILLFGLDSGAILWRQAFPSLPGAPESASLLTADSHSVFFFWGLPPSTSTNQTVQAPQDAPHSLYMFHPTIPGFLLELLNVSAQVVAFRVVVLEPSRHATILLLIGPGPVSLVKYKVRDLIQHGRLVSLQKSKPDSELAIRDRFSRLRYLNTKA